MNYSVEIGKGERILNDPPFIYSTTSNIKRLFSDLHDNGIRYCHWKSNEHLKAGLEGDTDLDILFDEDQKKEIEFILTRSGFKLFKPARQREYASIEDYIGLDYASGKVFHLHSHFRLSLGENYLKSYQLYLESLVLESRVFDENVGVFVTHPALELILLFIRHAFKTRNRDKIKHMLGKVIPLPANAIKEYEWLKLRCKPLEVKHFLMQVFEDDPAVTEIITGHFERGSLIKLSALIVKKFRGQRLYHPITALVTRWYREFSIKNLKRFAKVSGSPVVLRRINPRGGLVIAVIGADGCGKSTIINNLEINLRKKLDVFQIYFGKGGGKSSWYRRLFFQVKNKLQNIKGNPKKKSINQVGNKTKGPVKQPGKSSKVFGVIEAVMVYWEKLNNHRYMQQAKEKGMLVICDRYPQNQVFGYNDGPALQQYSGSANKLLRSLAKKEKSAYDFLYQNPPDIIFKLVADVNVIAARKPNETPLNMLNKKLQGIKDLQFPGPCKMIEINANLPLNEVLFEVRKNIWESYA